VIAGVVVGFILYRSPLPGAIFGGVAAVFVYLRVRKQESENRTRVLVTSLAFLAVVAVLPYLAMWKHHRAEYVLWKSGVRIVQHPERGQPFGNGVISVLLGPYIVPCETSLRFIDDPVRWDGISFEDKDLERLKPYLDSIRGVDAIIIECDAITDHGLAQLANVQGVTSIELVSDKVTARGVQHFEKMASLDSLLIRCPQVDDSIVALLREFPKLQYLYLDETQISDAAAREFVAFPNLRQITVPQSATDETIGELRKSIKVVLKVDQSAGGHRNE
jgi:hypothetical protein